MTEWDGMAVLLTKESHSDKLTVPDIMSTIVTPSIAMCALSGLLMPWVIKGFDSVALNMKRDGFIIR